jgi:hypothetical protein
LRRHDERRQRDLSTPTLDGFVSAEMGSRVMTGKLISMAITQIESGATTLQGYYLTDLNLIMETIVRIEKVETYVISADDTYEILIDGHGLDAAGGVFPITSIIIPPVDTIKAICRAIC